MSATNKAKARPKAKTRPFAPSAEEYYRQGIEALEMIQPEVAYKFLSQANSMKEGDVNVLDALVEACVQLGRRDEALSLCSHCITINPTGSYERWLTLAQLQSGRNALYSYQRGGELLTEHMSSLDVSITGEMRLHSLRAALCRIYASMAELFLTDLCFEDGAEQNCEKLVGMAQTQDAANLDGLQVMASLRLSQNRTADATPILSEVYRQTMLRRTAYNQRTILQDLIPQVGSDEEVLDNGEDDIPSIDFSLQTAKMIVECAKDNPELNVQAIELLSDLLEDDDEIIEIWYVIGVAALGLRPPDCELARHNLERAREMMNVILEQTGPVEFPFGEQMCLVDEHLKILEVHEQTLSGGGGAIGGLENAATTIPSPTLDQMEEVEWSESEQED